MFVVAEVGQDRAAGLDEMGCGDELFAFEVAAGQAGYGGDGAGAVDLDAVVPAGDPVAEVFAEREAGAAMGAAVLQHVEGAVGAAEEEPFLAEEGEALHAAGGDEVGGADGVPLVAYAGAEETVGGAVAGAGDFGGPGGLARVCCGVGGHGRFTLPVVASRCGRCPRSTGCRRGRAGRGR